MNLFQRLFSPKKLVRPVIPPDDSQLRKKLEAAKEANTSAVTSFVEAIQRQERDAEFARRVVTDLLNRAENIKVVEHAGIKK